MDYIVNQFVSRLKQEIDQRCGCEKFISTHQVNCFCKVNEYHENDKKENTNLAVLKAAVK